LLTMPFMSKGFSRSCCVLNSSIVMRQYTMNGLSMDAV
jgi:hypothetical protein